MQVSVNIFEEDSNQPLKDLIQKFTQDNNLDTKFGQNPDILIITGSFGKSYQEIKEYLLNCKKVVIANLKDEAVAEVIKDVMKEIPVTVIDYTKHQIRTQNPDQKALFQLGLSLGISPEAILKTIR